MQLIHGDVDIPSGPAFRGYGGQKGSLEKLTQCDSTRFTGSTQRVLEGGWNDRLIGESRQPPRHISYALRSMRLLAFTINNRVVLVPVPNSCGFVYHSTRSPADCLISPFLTLDARDGRLCWQAK